MDLTPTTAPSPRRRCAWATWFPQARAAAATRVRMEAFIEISFALPLTAGCDRLNAGNRAAANGRHPGRETSGKCPPWYVRQARYGILGSLTVWDGDLELS